MPPSSSRNPPFILVGCLLAFGYWVVEAYLDTLMIENVSFAMRLFPSDKNELWMRSITFLLFIGFGLYSHRAHARIRSTELMNVDAAWLLKKALSKTIRGNIPICALCRKARNQEGEWVTLEKLVTARTEAEFSAGICNKCQIQHSSDKTTGARKMKMNKDGNENRVKS
jgi:hypothetical protein